jgi:hypothetical protein
MFAVMPLERFAKGLSEMNVQVEAVSNGRARPSLRGFGTGAMLGGPAQSETARTAGQTSRRRTGIEPACELSPAHRF